MSKKSFIAVGMVILALLCIIALAIFTELSRWWLFVPLGLVLVAAFVFFFDSEWDISRIVLISLVILALVLSIIAIWKAFNADVVDVPEDVVKLDDKGNAVIPGNLEVKGDISSSSIETEEIHSPKGKNLDVDTDNSLKVNAKDIDINAKGNVDATVDGNVKTEVKGNVETHIGGDSSTKIDGNATVEVEKDANVTVKGDANVDVKGDLNANIEGDANLHVGGDVNLNVDGKINVNDDKKDEPSKDSKPSDATPVDSTSAPTTKPETEVKPTTSKKITAPATIRYNETIYVNLAGCKADDLLISNKLFIKFEKISDSKVAVTLTEDVTGYITITDSVSKENVTIDIVA